MAPPRSVSPGVKYLLTRRCAQRTFRLRPSHEITAIFKYCLALALEKTGVRLHAICVMSNHHHAVITDERGVLPEFLRELHRATAKALNALQGESENVWAAEPCSVVRLDDADDVIETIAYVIANPVAAGLVEDPAKWPGLIAWGESSEEVQRPKVYFSGSGTSSPLRIALRLVAPSFDDGSADASTSWFRKVRIAIGTKVSDARQSIRAAGRRFAGRSAVLAQSILSRAASAEPRYGAAPSIAARDPVTRSAASAALQAFRIAYSAARRSWCDGFRDAVFPFGTWWMRVHHGVKTHARPAPG